MEPAKNVRMEKRERKLNQAIIATIREPLVIMDGSLSVILASRNFYETFHVTPAETIGKQLYDLGDGQWDIPALRQLLIDTLEKQESVEAFDVELDFPTIGRRAMVLNARKIYRDENTNASKAILLAIEDITERKAIEKALHENSEALKLRMAQLNASKLELQEKSKRLSQLVETEAALNKQLQYEVDAKNRFFSVIAHDLKSPFNSLLGMTQLMSQMAEKFSKEQLVDYAGDVNKAGEKVFELLRNLLDWSRVQIDGGKTQPQAIFLFQVCQDCIELFATIAQNKNIHVVNKIENSKGFADPDMVKTIVRNLIANSLKFTSPGGTVEISSCKSEGMVQITVADTGVGLSKEKAEKVFFLDQNNSTLGTSGEDGTGLGLPLCKDMVERNGGHIWVDSRIGKGTKFHFTLPRYSIGGQ